MYDNGSINEIERGSIAKNPKPEIEQVSQLKGIHDRLEREVSRYYNYFNDMERKIGSISRPKNPPNVAQEGKAEEANDFISAMQFQLDSLAKVNDRLYNLVQHTDGII